MSSAVEELVQYLQKNRSEIIGYSNGDGPIGHIYFAVEYKLLAKALAISIEDLLYGGEE